MATINIVFAKIGGKGNNEPVYKGNALGSENVTSSGTSAQTTGDAAEDCYVRIFAIDGAIYAKTGPNPTAAAGDEWYIASGDLLDLAVNAGDKVAVIDA
jgi:hypothetical protein